jgi:hypothetical protein
MHGTPVAEVVSSFLLAFFWLITNLEYAHELAPSHFLTYNQVSRKESQ